MAGRFVGTNKSVVHCQDQGHPPDECLRKLSCIVAFIGAVIVRVELPDDPVVAHDKKPFGLPGGEPRLQSLQAIYAQPLRLWIRRLPRAPPEVSLCQRASLRKDYLSSRNSRSRLHPEGESGANST